MHFTCESCRATLHIADDKVKGKRLVVRCKRCGNKINIADPALGAGAAARAGGPGGAPPRGSTIPPPAAKPAPAPAPQMGYAPVDPGGDAKGDSDTESTRAMETSVLEEALRASKAADDGSVMGMKPLAAPPPPPAPPRDPPIWFAMVGGKQIGPVSRAELGLKTAQGAVGPRTYVWKDGMAAWQRAKDVTELGSLFAEPGKPIPPPPIPSQPVLQPVAAAQPQPAGGTLHFANSPVARGSLDPDVPAPAKAAAPPAKAVQKPAPEPAKPMDISIEGYKPLRVDDGGDEQTNLEELPLGERVHQEKVAKELFTSGEHGSGASALDLARWASEELDKRPRNKKAPGNGRAAPSAPPPAAAAPAPAPAAPARTPLVDMSEEPTPQPADPSQPPAELEPAAADEEPLATTPGESTGKLFADVGAPRSRRPLLIAAVLTMLILTGVVLAWAFAGGGRPTAPAKEGASTRAAPGGESAAARTATKGAPADTAAPKTAPAAPAAATGDAPAAAGKGLSREAFERVVAERQSEYKPCVDEARRREPNMKPAKVVIHARIATTGKVVDADIDRKEVEATPLGQCLLRTTRQFVFPPFSGEQTAGSIPLLISGGD